MFPVVKAVIISNYSNKDLYLLPIDEELQKQWGFLIKAGNSLTLEPFNLNECFFQFKGSKRKIKPKNINRHKVKLQKFI